MDSSLTGNGFAGSWFDTNSTDDYLFVRNTEFRDEGGGLARFLVLGLDPSEAYEVELVASRSSAGQRLGNYRVNGANSDNGNSVGFDSFVDGFTAHDTMLWTGAVPTIDPQRPGDGPVLTIEWDGFANPDFSGFAYLNAVRINGTFVPEPATGTALAVMSLVAFGCPFRRCRKFQLI